MISINLVLLNTNAALKPVTRPQHYYPYFLSSKLSVMEHRVIVNLDPRIGVISLVHATIIWWWSLFIRSFSLWIWLYFKKLIKEKEEFYLMVMLGYWMHMVNRFNLICQQIVLRICVIILWFIFFIFNHPV